MRKILLVCAALACMTVSPVPAQDAAVKKIIEMGQNDNQVMHQLDILTNRFGGRLIGSDAYENAAEWMVREFKSWGLDVQFFDFCHRLFNFWEKSIQLRNYKWAYVSSFL